jgi:hypothetical protein
MMINTPSAVSWKPLLKQFKSYLVFIELLITEIAWRSRF